MDLKAVIRTIPDYPIPGIMFRDITTLLGDAKAFRACVDAMAITFADQRIDKVAGIEARGFILGGAVRFFHFSLFGGDLFIASHQAHLLGCLLQDFSVNQLLQNAQPRSLGLLLAGFFLDITQVLAI